MIEFVIFSPFALMILIWLIWDFLALIGKIDQPMISVEVWYLSKQYPIIPSLIFLIVGILIGHFEWQMPDLLCVK